MKKLLLILLLFGCYPSFAQDNKCLILFTDKASSPYTIGNPLVYLSQKSIDRRQRQGIPIKHRDLPPNPSYVSGLEALGVEVLYTTKWFNGVWAKLDSSLYSSVEALPYVDDIPYKKSISGGGGVRLKASKNKFELEEVSTLTYGNSLEQIELMDADVMHDEGYKGSGMLIGFLDSGFYNVDNNTCLSHIYPLKVIDTWDYEDAEADVYDDHNHGAHVLSAACGLITDTHYGPAFEADVALYRTEVVASETKAEEVYWLLAAERADSLGVDVINTSLGYSTFDSPEVSYTTANMDGNTAICTRAADIAADTGMVVVASAGNSGASATWPIIATPADADSVLAIGAVNRSGVYASFSSKGNTQDGRIKPDAVAVGQGTSLCTTSGAASSSNGTSFSSPLVAGLVASYWQSKPYLTAQEIVRSIRKGGHLFASPTIELGYGYANYTQAKNIQETEFPYDAIKPNSNIDFVKVLPNSSEVTIKYNAALLGNQIRFSIINLNIPSTVFQNTFTLASVENVQAIPTDCLVPGTLLRIEDLTQAETLAIYTF